MKNDILDSMKRLNRVIKRHESVMNPISYGRGQGRMLRLIMDKEGITARELALLMDIRPPSLTEKLDRLEADGNAMRVRDRNDMRVVRIYITDKGRESVERRATEKNTVSRDFADCLTKEEKKLFCNLTDRLIKRMEQITIEEQAEKDNIVLMNQDDTRQKRAGQKGKKTVSGRKN